jgi:hypothetical protein
MTKKPQDAIELLDAGHRDVKGLFDDYRRLSEHKAGGAKRKALAVRPGDELYDAKVTVLGEYIAHHVRQEREEMFPKVRKSGIDLAALGEKLRARRQELQALPEALREDALACVSA